MMNGHHNHHLPKESIERDAASARIVLERIDLPSSASSTNGYKVTDQSIVDFIARDDKRIQSAKCTNNTDNNFSTAEESDSCDFEFDMENIMTIKESLLVLQRIPLPNDGERFNIHKDPLSSFIRQDRKKVLKLQMERNSRLTKPSVDSIVPETYTNRPDIKNFKNLFRRKKGSGRRFLTKTQRKALMKDRPKYNYSYNSKLTDQDKKIRKCLLCDKWIKLYKLDEHLSKVHDEDNPELW